MAEVARLQASGVQYGLQIVERLVRLEVSRLRAAGASVEQDEYRGLYLSDAQIDGLLAHPARADLTTVASDPDREFNRARQDLSALATNAVGPLATLIQLAHLNPFEVGCLLLCLALEVDLRFERLFAYVQDDVTKRRPRVDLAIRLLAQPPAGAEARSAFSIDAPLRRFQLLSLHDEMSQSHTPLLAQTLALDARIAGFLLGQTTIDESLRPYAELESAPDGHLPFPDELIDQINALSVLPATDLSDSIIHLTGRTGVGLQQVAQALAQGAGLGLLAVHFPALVNALGLDRAYVLAQREAALQQAALFLIDLHLLKPEQAEQLRVRLNESRLAPLTLLGSDGAFSCPGLTIQLPEPDFAARLELWKNGLGAVVNSIVAGQLEKLAGKFRLTAQPESHRRSAAHGGAQWRNPGRPAISLDDLYAAARSQSTPILNSLARKIAPHYTWDDIVLPADTLQHLHEMRAYVEHRHVVYERWGFERKLALGKGLMALFARASGTGKPRAADILVGPFSLAL